MQGLLLLLLLWACLGSAFFVRDGRRMLDSYGRERIFHGVNVVAKSAPYLPVLSGAWDTNTTLVAEDYALLESWGFNMIRLGTMWPGVAPAPGVINRTYLSAVQSIVASAANSGIYVLLDLHQDLMSPFFCGEGAPDYLVQPAGGLAEFPLPVRLPYKGRPYPTAEECFSRGFGDYYPAAAVGKSFQQLYENANGFQDALLQFWVTVASYFASNPLVLGYELLNEPWAGDIYDHPNQLFPGVTDAKWLAPMYSRLMRAIRSVDSKHMIFFEPMVMGASSGFTAVPANDSNAVYAYHIYCLPNDSQFCKDVLYALFVAKNGDSLRLAVPGFMTEFGAVSDDPFYLDFQVSRVVASCVALTPSSADCAAGQLRRLLELLAVQVLRRHYNFRTWPTGKSW
jgi:endoglycosylceramidase